MWKISSLNNIWNVWKVAAASATIMPNVTFHFVSKMKKWEEERERGNKSTEEKLRGDYDWFHTSVTTQILRLLFLLLLMSFLQTVSFSLFLLLVHSQMQTRNEVTFFISQYTIIHSIMHARSVIISHDFAFTLISLKQQQQQQMKKNWISFIRLQISPIPCNLIFFFPFFIHPMTSFNQCQMNRQDK